MIAEYINKQIQIKYLIIHESYLNIYKCVYMNEWKSFFFSYYCYIFINITNSLLI